MIYSFCYVFSRYKFILLLRTAEPYREFFVVCKKIKLLENIFGEACKTTVIDGMNAVFEDYRNSWLFTNSRGELRSEIKVSRFESSCYLCAELSSVVIARLMSECLWSGWKWWWRVKEMPSPFSCSPVICEWLWKKTQIEKKMNYV